MMQYFDQSLSIPLSPRPCYALGILPYHNFCHQAIPPFKMMSFMDGLDFSQILESTVDALKYLRYIDALFFFYFRLACFHLPLLGKRILGIFRIFVPD